MENALEENWGVIRSLLPEGWEERAQACGAVARLRGFASPEALLRTLLLHVARGYSLRETLVQAKAAGLAEASDVALLKRLRKEPFVWTATLESIKEKLSRCRQTLEQIQSGCALPRGRKRRKTLST